MPVEAPAALLPKIRDPEYNHELGMFAFATPDDYRLAPCLKLNRGRIEGVAFAVDPCSVPEEVYRWAEDICSKVFEETAAPGFAARMDFYRSRDDELRLREINLRDPGMNLNGGPFEPIHLYQHAHQLAALCGVAR
jgi:hypothetical protein